MRKKLTFSDYARRSLALLALMTLPVFMQACSSDSNADTGNAGNNTADVTDEEFKDLRERVTKLEGDLADALAALEALSGSVRVVATRESVSYHGSSKLGTLADATPIGCANAAYNPAQQRLATHVQCQADSGTHYSAPYNGGTPGDPVVLHYATSDCSGQAYVEADEIGTIARADGIVIAGGDDVAYWIRPGLASVSVTIGSSLATDGRCLVNSGTFAMLEAIVNDPALSGVENSYAPLTTVSVSE